MTQYAIIHTILLKEDSYDTKSETIPNAKKEKKKKLNHPPTI